MTCQKSTCGANEVPAGQTHESRPLAAASIMFKFTSGICQRRRLEKRHEGDPESASAVPAPGPLYPYKAARLQERRSRGPRALIRRLTCARKSLRSPLIYWTRSGGQVFHSDAINHSPHNTPSQRRERLFPCPDFSPSEGAARGSFPAPEAGLSVPPSALMCGKARSRSNWLRTRHCIFFIGLSKCGNGK